MHLLRPFLILFAACLALAASAQTTKQSFDLKAAPAESALKQFSEVSGQQVIFPTEIVRNVRTQTIKGDYTPQEALDRMLAKTGLVAAQDEKTGAFAIRQETPIESKNAPSRPASDRAASDEKDGVIKLETFEVMGSKLLNMDIKRTRDDAQPYVIFDRAQIERSGVTTLDDFLKQRLTMNTQGQSPSQFIQSTGGGTSQINLRGLGAEQTLILVDGHRIAGFGSISGITQADINGIPLAAIERIEVLPTTASGIYGGAATGGVVNVILRRDYAGAELRVSYENTFDTDAAIRTVDLSAGFTLEHGKTNVLLALSHRDSNLLMMQDRHFVQRGRASLIANNPSSIFANATPPLASTPNIRSTNGTPLTLKTGGSLNSAITYVPIGYLGTDNGAALIANAGQYNLKLADTAAQGTGGVGGRFATSNAPEVNSGTMTIRRQFSPVFQMFLEAAAADNTGHFPNSSGLSSGGALAIPTTSPVNPFNQAITVTIPVLLPDTEVLVKTNSRRAVLGALFQLPKEWKAEADFTWSTTYFYSNSPAFVPATFNAAVTAGAINPLRDLRISPIDYTPYLNPPTTNGPVTTTLLAGSIRASGPIWQLPAGPATLSSLLEYRDEVVPGFPTSFLGVTSFRPERSQSTASSYLEAHIPFFSSRNARPGLQELELQLAGRYDEYTVRGTVGSVASPTSPIARATNQSRSTNPTIGLRYSPAKGLILRASYGTGFLPPSVAQLVPAAPITSTLGAVDPLRGNSAIVGITTVSGGNPNLRPEQSTSWSAGLIYQPEAISGFRLSLDYTRIRKKDNIIGNFLSSGTASQAFIVNEPNFPGRIVRGPNLPGDLPGWPGPIVSIDFTAANIAQAEVEALDAGLDYHRKTERWGTFDFFALATYQLRFDTQLVAGAPIADNIGVNSLINSVPVEFRGNAGATWEYRGLSVGWNLRYTDGFYVRDPTLSTSATIIANQGNGGWVGSELYHDLFLTYRFARNSGATGFHHRAISGLEVQIGIKNVFDRFASFDAGNPNAFYNYLGETRGRSYLIGLKRAF